KLDAEEIDDACVHRMRSRSRRALSRIASMLSSPLAAGQVAEWSCSGLQSHVRRFDSDPRLQKKTGPAARCGEAVVASDVHHRQPERSLPRVGVAPVESAFDTYGQKPPSIA